MGADLYIASEYEGNHAKWEPVFSRWVEIRDKLSKAGKKREARRAQRKVEKYFDRMLSKGYFRDSYNSTNLLWKFGVSWWMDIDKFITDGRWIPPENAEAFLRFLSDRERNFEAALKAEPQKEYFTRKYGHFKAFLKRAIAKGETIRCSI